MDIRCLRVPISSCVLCFSIINQVISNKTVINANTMAIAELSLQSDLTFLPNLWLSNKKTKNIFHSV